MDNISESHVAVKSSPTAGNGLFATKDIAAGELVLMLKRPLVGVLDIPRLEDTCSNCFMWSVGSIECSLPVEKPTINACTGCKKVKYCSKKCQSQSWKREHKYICKFLADLPPLPSTVRAGREIAILLDSDKTSEETKTSIRRMQKHTFRELFRASAQEASDHTAAAAFGASVEALRDIRRREGHDFFEKKGINSDYVGQIYRNSLTLVTPLYDPLGLAFDPLLCTANHSCVPNTTVVMDGPLISLRSLIPIEKDGEVFISYIDHTNPFTIRQAQLKDRYCFTCICPKCALGPTQREDDWLHPASKLSPNFDRLGPILYAETEFAKDPANYVGESPDERRLAGLQGLAFYELNEVKDIKDPKVVVGKCEDIMRLCKQSNVWPITRQPYAAARNQIFASMLEAGSPGIAMYQMIKTYFLIDPVLYPQEFHPVRVVHTWGLAKVMMWLYERHDHPMTTSLHSQGFDFVVIIWKLLKQLKGLVGRSHGFSRFRVMVEGTAEEVRREIADKLDLIERDPQNQWRIFEFWKDALEY